MGLYLCFYVSKTNLKAKRKH